MGPSRLSAEGDGLLLVAGLKVRRLHDAGRPLVGLVRDRHQGGGQSTGPVPVQGLGHSVAAALNVLERTVGGGAGPGGLGVDGCLASQGPGSRGGCRCRGGRASGGDGGSRRRGRRRPWCAGNVLTAAATCQGERPYGAATWQRDGSVAEATGAAGEPWGHVPSFAPYTAEHTHLPPRDRDRRVDHGHSERTCTLPTSWCCCQPGKSLRLLLVGDRTRTPATPIRSDTVRRHRGQPRTDTPQRADLARAMSTALEEVALAAGYVALGRDDRASRHSNWHWHWHGGNRCPSLPSGADGPVPGVRIRSRARAGPGRRHSSSNTPDSPRRWLPRRRRVSSACTGACGLVRHKAARPALGPLFGQRAETAAARAPRIRTGCPDCFSRSRSRSKEGGMSALPAVRASGCRRRVGVEAVQPDVPVSVDRGQRRCGFTRAEAGQQLVQAGRRPCTHHIGRFGPAHGRGGHPARSATAPDRQSGT